MAEHLRVEELVREEIEDVHPRSLLSVYTFAMAAPQGEPLAHLVAGILPCGSSAGLDRSSSPGTMYLPPSGLINKKHPALCVIQSAGHYRFCEVFLDEGTARQCVGAVLEMLDPVVHFYFFTSSVRLRSC